MYRPLPLFIGLRFTRSKNANKFLSFISLVSMTGLILGVAALIVVMSVLNGFEDALSKRILGMVPQASIYASQPLEDWAGIASMVEENDPNVIGTAPFVQARGMLSLGGEVNSTIINGIEPSSHANVSILKESMVAGDFDSLDAGSKHIILGEYVVEKYGLKIGDKIGIIISSPSRSTTGVTPTFHSYTLTGVFHVSQEIDKWMSYIAMDDASDIVNLDHGAAGIRLRLKDVFLSKEAAKSAQAAVSNTVPLHQNLSTKLTFTSNDWTQSHGSLYSSIRMQKTIMSLLLFLIILVAAFNIISTLVMSVVEKRSDIAILRTFGVSSKLVSRIFIVQGMFIGMSGILIGTVFGVLLSLSLPSVSWWVNTTFNLGLFDNYFVEALPIKLEGVDLFFILSSTFVVVLLSTIYPAYSAANIEPVKILNSE
ncbi:lipoprotein-releasing ABC transporter permease subunit [Psychrobacter celer]|uniref:lipoprotein-releasing ABC transporter permease subunit n=1 Tax=Psychrobacter celer TaxID=306572 RepID=UPI003FD64671